MQQKKNLITTCLVLLVASYQSPQRISAAEHAATLPKAMTDENWRTCMDDDGETTSEEENTEIYSPNDGAECGDRRGWIFQFYSDDEGYTTGGATMCFFDKIEQITSTIYRTHAQCKHGPDRWTAHQELEIIDGRLVIREIPEG
jgi:hypothetical protein